MSNHDVVDPIEAVGGVKRTSSAGQALPAESTNKAHKGEVASCNYILEVMKYTNIAMQHQADIVSLRGELASVVTKMQGDLATISEFLSKIESMSHAGGFFQKSIAGGIALNPNALNGLSPDFYALDDGSAAASGTTGTDTGAGMVSDAYKNSMGAFVSAVRDLYYCSSTGNGPTVSELTTIANPHDSSGKSDFDMTSYWNKLQSSYGNGPNQVPPGKGYDYSGMHVIGTDPKAHASLLQQYMFYQAQLTVNTGTKQDVMNAGGDITKLVNFDPMSSQNNLDSNIAPALAVLDSLNADIKADRNDCTHSAGDGTTAPNILSMILLHEKGLLNTYHKTGPFDLFNGDGWTQNGVGLYGAFAYAAYNYAFTKNPNADPSVGNSTFKSSTGPALGPYIFNPSGTLQVNNGDSLSGMYSAATTAQTSLSSSGNQTNTSFQQDVNSVQQIDGAAGKMVDGYNQSQSTWIHNFKGS